MSRIPDSLKDPFMTCYLGAVPAIDVATACEALWKLAESDFGGDLVLEDKDVPAIVHVVTGEAARKKLAAKKAGWKR